LKYSRSTIPRFLLASVSLCWMAGALPERYSMLTRDHSSARWLPHNPPSQCHNALLHALFLRAHPKPTSPHPLRPHFRNTMLTRPRDGPRNSTEARAAILVCARGSSSRLSGLHRRHHNSRQHDPRIRRHAADPRNWDVWRDTTPDQGLKTRQGRLGEQF
jgi:hypothetical protein